MIKRIIQFIFGLVLASSLGCTDRAGPWGTVAGVVNCHGQPVDSAIVLFSNREIGVEMTAETDASGRFTIRTDRINGLPAGAYRVSVMPKPTNLPPPEQGMMFVGPAPRPAASNIPDTDRDINTTRLTAVVNEGTNEFTFDLQR